MAAASCYMFDFSTPISPKLISCTTNLLYLNEGTIFQRLFQMVKFLALFVVMDKSAIPDLL